MAISMAARKRIAIHDLIPLDCRQGVVAPFILAPFAHHAQIGAIKRHDIAAAKPPCPRQQRACPNHARPHRHRRNRRRPRTYRALRRFGADRGPGDAGDDQSDRGRGVGGDRASAADRPSEPRHPARRQPYRGDPDRRARDRDGRSAQVSRAAPSPSASKPATSSSRSAAAPISGSSSAWRASTNGCSAKCAASDRLGALD